MCILGSIKCLSSLLSSSSTANFFQFVDSCDILWHVASIWSQENIPNFIFYWHRESQEQLLLFGKQAAMQKCPSTSGGQNVISRGKMSVSGAQARSHLGRKREAEAGLSDRMLQTYMDQQCDGKYLKLDKSNRILLKTFKGQFMKQMKERQ